MAGTWLSPGQPHDHHTLTLWWLQWLLGHPNESAVFHQPRACDKGHNKIRTKTWRIGMNPNDMGYGMGYRTQERLTWQLKKSGWQSWSLAGAASQSQSSYRQKGTRALLSLKLHPTKSESLHTHTCSYPRIYQAAIHSAKRDRKFYYSVCKSSKTLFQGSGTIDSH